MSAISSNALRLGLGLCLVLGAWGCGAFGNDGRLIARLFHEAIDGEFRGVFQEIVFAITDWSDDKKFIGPFQKAFASGP